MLFYANALQIETNDSQGAPLDSVRFPKFFCVSPNGIYACILQGTGRPSNFTVVHIKSGVIKSFEWPYRRLNPESGPEKILAVTFTSDTELLLLGCTGMPDFMVRLQIGSFALGQNTVSSFIPLENRGSLIFPRNIFGLSTDKPMVNIVHHMLYISFGDLQHVICYNLETHDCTTAYIEDVDGYSAVRFLTPDFLYVIPLPACHIEPNLREYSEYTGRKVKLNFRNNTQMHEIQNVDSTKFTVLSEYHSSIEPSHMAKSYVFSHVHQKLYLIDDLRKLFIFDLQTSMWSIHGLSVMASEGRMPGAMACTNSKLVLMLFEKDKDILFTEVIVGGTVPSLFVLCGHLLKSAWPLLTRTEWKTVGASFC